MKKKISIKIVLSMLLSAILFYMPVVALIGNSMNTMKTNAQEEVLEIDNTDGIDGSNIREENKNVIQENIKETEKTVSGDEIQELRCTCQDKCSQYSANEDCEICKEDYSRCAYINPNVKITIHTPTGWHNNSAKVRVAVTDVVESGNFAIQMVQAKISQNGSWIDITEDMYVEISENSTVYVLVTDQRGKTYEKNRYIKCFDFTKPTLNAAVNDGLLSVQAYDADSDIEAVYVNGYEFTEINNGMLNIRLQQFDSGYQYFTIQAMDCAGNMSEVYKTANPYYTDPEKEDNNESNSAKQLPVNAGATAPSSATAQVTEHTKIDGSNIRAETSVAESEKEKTEEEAERSEKGKEFYTIQTASEKVFYLVIDRNGDEEKVYFLTEVSENDLLNVTEDNSEILPQNSAALESAIPVAEGALTDNDVGDESTGEREETEGEEGTEEYSEELQLEPERESSIVVYLILGVIAAVMIGGYYFKVIQKKKEDFLDEDDDEEDENEEYEDDEEEMEEEEDDFFDKEDNEC